MKKAKIIASSLLAVLILLSAFAGCAGGTPEGTGEITRPDGTSAAPESTVALKDPEYVIIRKDEASDTVNEAALSLRNALNQKLGTSLKVKVDLIAEKAGYRVIPTEIIVGDTNRDETAAALAGLRRNDYIIKLDGTKLVIVGGCDEATAAAVTRFIDGGFIPEDGILRGNVICEYSAEYPVSEFKLNGTDISEYTIVFQKKGRSVYLKAAELLRDRIGELCGPVLKLVDSGEEPSAHEIQFGDCGRGPSEGLSASGIEYALRAGGGSVAVACGSSGIAESAVSALMAEWLPEGASGSIAVTIDEGVTQTMSAAFDQLTAGANLRVMTSNILASDTLVSRSSILRKVYTLYYPDVIGLQECNANGHTNVVSGMSELYASTATKIDGTSSGCYTPILYRRDRFKLVESGSKLFDQRWPKTNTKTMAWAVLEEISTGKKIAVINGHWSLILSSYDTESVFGRKLTDADAKLWREDNTREALAKLEELKSKYGEDIAAFMMGDMNSNASAKSVSMIYPTMKNCIDLATVSRTTGINSYHGDPGKYPTGTSAIDHIFVTDKTVKVFRHEIILTEDGVACSDHCPVFADVAF